WMGAERVMAGIGDVPPSSLWPGCLTATNAQSSHLSGLHDTRTIPRGPSRRVVRSQSTPGHAPDMPTIATTGVALYPNNGHRQSTLSPRRGARQVGVCPV